MKPFACSTHRIAEVIGAGLGVPVKSIAREEAQSFFGWFSLFADLDMAASSELTRERLNWHPTGPGMIEDLEQADYSIVGTRVG